MPQKTPGSRRRRSGYGAQAAGAEPQDLVIGETPGAPESLIGVRRLSNSC